MNSNALVLNALLSMNLLLKFGQLKIATLFSVINELFRRKTSFHVPPQRFCLLKHALYRVKYG